MAVDLIRSNDEFKIYGPIIMNAEVIAYQEEIKAINKLGISYKREHLHKLVKENYPHIEEIIETSHVSLPYSLKIGQVKGAVLDITKASLLPEFKFIYLSENDYISYSLVVKKDIVGTKGFENFISIYNEVAEKLNKMEVLSDRIDMTENLENNTNIKFLFLE